MSILSAILAPSFLVNNIYFISLVLGVMILVILEEKTNHHIVFPLTDFIRNKTAEKIGETKSGRKMPRIRTWIAEWIATLIFILYFYFGAVIITNYIIAPILYKLRAYLLIVVIVIFLVTNHFIHSHRWRKKFFGVGVEKG